MSVVPLSPPNPRDPRRAERERLKLEKRLRRLVGQAIADYGMIEEGDRIMVCLSGGKDSHTLLDLLRRLRARAPVRFELVAVHLDQKQPGYDPELLPRFLEAEGVPYRILEQDTYSVVKRVVPEGKTMCGLCSRLRRGALYACAKREGFTKIALGHHADDIVATFFLNLFFHGRIAAMPPKLRSDDGEHIVIRPLAYCRERDIARYATSRGFPILPCRLCGSQEGLEREAVKAMLAEWDRRHPGRVENILRALASVRPSQLLDRELFDFGALRRGGGPPPDPRAWLLSAGADSPRDGAEAS